MATSGTTNFNLDIADLITEAYERCGMQVQAGYNLRTARRSLDLLFADWANRGLNLWTIEQRTLSLSTGVNTYNLPTDTVDVLSAVVRFSNQGVNTDITIDRISRAEYLNTPVKSQQARPAQYYVERTIQPKLYLYPTPDPSTTYTFVYYAIRRIQDAGDYTNTPDVNFRFLPCLAAGLAYYLALKKAPERITFLKQIYEEEFARAAAEDRERASVYLVPDFGY
jgi:hypothetical protein